MRIEVMAYANPPKLIGHIWVRKPRESHADFIIMNVAPNSVNAECRRFRLPLATCADTPEGANARRVVIAKDIQLEDLRQLPTFEETA